MWRRVFPMSEPALGARRLGNTAAADDRVAPDDRRRRVLRAAAAWATTAWPGGQALAQNATWQAPAPVAPHPHDGFSEHATDPSLDPMPPGRAPLQVGPSRSLKTLGQAARAAQAGDVIEVDAGEYRGDAALAAWTQASVVLRAVGGRVRLLAQGAHTEGKAIWVTRGQRLAVQGFDFEGATVHHQNGAGIRHERGALFVRDCRFLHNENGILTGNTTRSVLEVQNCEFGHNGFGDGLSHNLYAGRIARLLVQGCWMHHAKHGHLLKSRALHSDVRYNHLADGAGGQASYELEFPNGGVAQVVGNVIVQAASTQNRSIIAFGAEGYVGPRHELLLVHNTVVDEGTLRGRTLQVAPGAGVLLAANNIVVGANGLAGAESAAAQSHLLGNFGADHDEFDTAYPGQYRLHPQSRLRGRAAALAELPLAQVLQPLREYAHPRHSVALGGVALHPGAVQQRGTS